MTRTEYCYNLHIGKKMEWNQVGFTVNRMG